MPFKDYVELKERLQLPINGKLYTIPAMGLAEGIELTDQLEAAARGEDLPDKPFAEFNRMALGSAYDDMVADNVPADAIRRAALTQIADFQRGRAVAEVMWETGGDLKATQEWVKAHSNRAQRRTKVSTTPRQGSGTTRTRTPKKTSPGVES